MTSVGTLTLSDFLLARIAEDEAVAEAAASAWDMQPWNQVDVPARGHVEAWSPDVVLGECAAKRLITERLRRGEDEARQAWADYSDWIDGAVVADPPTRMIPSDQVAGLRVAVRLLALTYQHHPDYRDEWRP